MKIELGSGLFLLGIAFIVLKLCHVIDWSWWWVTLPIYGVVLLAFVVVFVAVVIGVFVGISSRR